MFADFKPTALLVKDEFPELDSPLDIAGAFDPFLSFRAVDSDAGDWMELLAYSWGVDWDTPDASAKAESDAV